MLYYRNDIPAMWEAKRKKKQSENEEAEGESKPTPPKHKMPAKRDLYTICRQAGKTHSRLLTALEFQIDLFKGKGFQNFKIFYFNIVTLKTEKKNQTEEKKIQTGHNMLFYKITKIVRAF